MRRDGTPCAGTEHDAGADHRDAALHSDPAHDLGAAPARPTPVRTCVGCRTRSPADGLLRVVAVNGVLTPDLRRRLPGRGAWLHPVPECLHRAERRSAFLRALRIAGPLDITLVWQHLIVVSGVGESPRPFEEESKVDPS
ncbi:MAG TPA: YlxR family protein [Pseudonocardia sp.]